jgi:hypothetical protein
MICLLYIQIEVTAGLEFNLKFILYGSLMTPLNDCCANDWGSVHCDVTQQYMNVVRQTIKSFCFP